MSKSKAKAKVKAGSLQRRVEVFLEPKRGSTSQVEKNIPRTFSHIKASMA